MVLLIIDKKEDKKRKIILTLATAGFLIFLGQQFLGYFSDKASAEIFENINKRTELINQKADTIDSNVSALKFLLTKLNHTSAAKIGLQVKSPRDLENLHAFEKGSAEAWRAYYSWLNSTTDGKTALRFTVNHGKNYHYSLVLLYAMTDAENSDFVQAKMESYTGWPNFPRESDWDLISRSKPLCELIIFEDGNGRILGFAKTHELLQNLKSINRNAFEYQLNSTSGNFLTFAQNNLSSFHKPTNGTTIQAVGESMIRENISETISTIDARMYYLSLSLLFELE